MALASFPDGSYLELIAIQPKADPAALAAHYWHKFMEADAGPCAWAIRPADFSGEVERLRKAGVSVTDPRRAARKRPDGVELDWETAQVGPTNGGFFPFMIHDFTPRDNRAFPSGKPATTEWSGRRKSGDWCSRSRRCHCAISHRLWIIRSPTAGRCRVRRQARVVFRNASCAGCAGQSPARGLTLA